MKISRKDRAVLRSLSRKIAEIASLPVHKEKMDLWNRLNRLEKVRPLVYIKEIPWHEMNVNDELTLQTKDEFCRQIEWKLRTTLYRWEHMPVDMVVEAEYHAPLAIIRDTGFGLKTKETTLLQDARGGILSHHYEPQIRDESDIKKIKVPEVSVDRRESEEIYEVLLKIFGDILAIEKCGIPGPWFAPWDVLVEWWGVEEVLWDLVERPELIHAGMDRLAGAYLHRLDQYEEFNVLSLNNGNFQIGSGGLGFTDELPQPGFDPVHVRPRDQWGYATAQIFAAVSPRMHEEFALRYERRWLQRFGLTYYGCCEPLHLKVDILKNIPNLRKISMSPWIELDIAAANIGSKYVFSYKPNPAVLATDKWNPVQARQNLELALEKTKDCVVEVILADISTVRNEPGRLWEWAEIAAKEVESYL